MMAYSKNTRIEVPALRRAALGNDCVKCGSPNSVGAHYSGVGSGRLGNGMGLKCHDVVIAQLCDRCHREFDGYQSGNDYERGWEFLMLCFETLALRVRDGLVKFK